MAKQRNPDGMGSFKKLKDGRVAWRQTKNGLTREISAKTPKELREKIKDVVDLPIIKEKYTVNEWFIKWFENYVIPLKKQATIEQYQYMYEGHIKPVIGKMLLKGVKPSDIQSVIARMNKKDLSTKTMKHAKNVMSVAFKRALKDKIIIATPVIDIDIPKKQSKARKTLNKYEIGKLLIAMANSRWIWSLKFALVTGLRRGELLALKWTDIDFVNKRMAIYESNSRYGLGDTKGSKIHYVPLSKLAIFYLAKQKEMLENEYNPSLYKDELKKGYIFVNQRGKLANPDTYYKTIVRFAEKAGIYATPHCLRHTFVYNSRHILTLKELQDILGHDESTTTLDIYGDMLDDTTDEVANKIDETFSYLEEEITKIEKGKSKVIPFRKVK